MPIKVEQVRAMLLASGRPYNADAKRSAVEYANSRRRAGAGLTAIGRELGVSPLTVEAWLASAALVPVEVVGVSAEQTVAKSTIVLVDTRRGLRVEGLNIDEVGQLLGRLR